MKKIIQTVLVVMMVIGFLVVVRTNPHVVETYAETPSDQVDACWDNDEYVNLTTYYKMSDGTWKTRDYVYPYRLEITGRMRSAVKDSSYIYLSKTKNITFEQACKASGLSSNINDYFDEEEAILVAIK